MTSVSRERSRGATRKQPALVAAFLALALVALSVRPSAGATTAAQEPAAVPASRVLVMPFDTAVRDPRSYWLGEASSVILTDSLIALGMPVMLRAERLRTFEVLRVPVVPGLSHATILRVAQLVKASHVVTGTLTLAEERLEVRARTVALDTGQMGPEISETGDLTDVFAIYDRLAVRLLPGSSGTPEQLEGSHPPIAAFEQYIKGLLAEAPSTRLSFLSEAVRLSPSLQRARIAIWEVHYDAGEHERALAAVRQVPVGHRLSRQARFLASISLLELGRHQAAFDELARLNAEQSDPTLLNNLGVVQLRRPPGSPGPRAVTYFNEAASGDGVDSLFNLGYAYWLDGDASAAVVWLREAVRRNPADHAAHYVLGEALDALGSATEAARERRLARQLSSVYGEWEAASPSSPVPRGLERIRMDLDLPDALRVENVIVADGQRDQRELAAFHLDTARRAYEAERDGEAIAELRRAVYLSPYEHEAHLLLGRAYFRSGRLADAIDALKISLWSRETAAARLALADAYERSGMVTEAVGELQTLLAQDAANVEARERLERLSGR